MFTTGPCCITALNDFVDTDYIVTTNCNFQSGWWGVLLQCSILASRLRCVLIVLVVDV